MIGNIALSFNGGVKASFQQVYDRLEEVWPYELFGRAEESLDQIADRLDPPQKAPDSSSSGSGSSSSGGHGSGGSQDTVSGQDAYQVPAGGLWEIDVKAQGCSVAVSYTHLDVYKRQFTGSFTTVLLISSVSTTWPFTSFSLVTIVRAPFSPAVFTWVSPRSSSPVSSCVDS